MSRLLHIDEDFDSSIEGAYDDRTDFTHEFKVTSPTDTSQDESIARYLQEQELIPQKVEFKEPDSKMHPKLLTQLITPAFEASKAKSEAEKYKEKYATEHVNRLAAEERLRAEEKLRNESQLAMLRNQERAREIDAFNRLALERSLYRASDPSYDRLLRWSMTLFPDYWPITRRNLVREAVSDLIKRELLLSSSEYELEDKIRKLINNTEQRDKKKSAPKPRKVASRKSKKSKKKSKAKSHISNKKK